MKGKIAISFAQVSCGAGISVVEVLYIEIGCTEVGPKKIDSDEVGIAEIGFAEISFAQVGLVKIGTTEISIAEFGSTEISFAQVWLNMSIFCPPLIPCPHPLFEDVKVFLISHTVYPPTRVILLAYCLPHMLWH